MFLFTHSKEVTMKNNNKTLRTLGCLLLLGCSVLQAQAATTLRFGFAGSDSDTQSLAAKEFAQRVKLSLIHI